MPQEEFMQSTLVVFDETARGERTHRVQLKLVSERLTVRELIERRVEAEVERFNLQRPINFKALVQPKDAEETAQGYRLRQHRDLDWREQADEAVKAFQEKCFFVMVDNKEIKELDQELTITDTTEIAFVKLMPIVGG